ncbi:hypothetical protein pipiens_014475 [Culex pipiens pipiens]|uniref:Fork-head domain-containing protein n=1 Tax=Culex pipiens pipiens TaxID=38569 RepID=A0ABD1CUE9_CULPP
MVLSTIPVETTHQLILQQHLAHQPPQQHHIITTGNTNQSAISSSVTAGNTGIIINNNNNNNTSFKNHNNIIISSSGGLAASSNNHTYTINLSSGHNGHAVITNGIPLQSYSSVTTSNSSNISSSSNSTTHSHHHHQQQQHQQYHHLHPAPNSAANGMATVLGNGTTTTTTATVLAPPGGQQSLAPPQSKLVVLQQGHLGENYITTTEGMNGVGNIVLLATEQMDSDHELINSSGSGSNNLVITSSSSSANGHPLSHHQHHAIRSAAATLTSNGVVVNGVGGSNDEELTPLTWLHDKNLLKGINLSKVPVSSPDSPRQVVGRLSPTSDFVEDSSVSEDNTSSANSSSDQSIGVYCTETLHPGGRPATIHHSSLHHLQHHPQQQHHHTTFQLSNGSGHKTITTTIHGDTIIEYTADDKELKSPSSTVSCASSSSSSPPSSSNSSLYSGSSPSPNSNTVVTSHGVVQNGGGGSGASTPHQHFHKKYLREEHVKQLKQVSSSYATPVKQQSTLKYEDGDLVEDRAYPSAPVKNGSGGYTMAASPNVSSDEYSSTYGGMKPPSPPLSPQQLGATALSGIHVLPQPPASPLPSPVGNGSKLSPPKAKHPTNVPYDPQVHVHSKPPFSFSSLIFMAIENCQQKALPVKEIYAWIVAHFPYFKTAPTGWKNSVRHNLSLNKCFQKVEKAANLGKGSLWMVEPQYRPNLIQALSRSPFHSGSGIDKTTYKAMQAQHQQHQRSTDSPTSSVGSSYSKDNFPYLASRLAPGDAQSHLHHLHDQQHAGHPDMDGDDFSRSSTPIDYDGGDLPHQTVTAGPYHVTYHPVGTTSNGINYSTAATSGMLPVDGSAPGSGDPNGRNWSADTIDDVNAATAMLALKHGPKVFTEGFHNGNPPVITTSPSEDHTYSAGGSIPPAGVASGRSSQTNSDNNSNGTSSDAAYESSEESQTLNATDLEEQRRQAGVDALLNLAGITNYSTPNSSLKRPASSMEPESTPPTPSASVIYQQYLESTPPSGYSVVVQAPPAAHRNSYYLPAEELSGHHLPSSYQSSPSPPKKAKTASARMLKKFKKKATWVR